MEQSHMLARPPPIPPAQEKSALLYDEASTANSLAALAALAPAPAQVPHSTLVAPESRRQPDAPPSASEPFVFNQTQAFAHHAPSLPLHSKTASSHQYPYAQTAYLSHSQLPHSPPSYSQSHDVASFAFPDAPKAELAPIQLPGETGPGTQWATHLPSLSSVTGQQSQRYSAPPSQPSEPSPPANNHWPSLNPLTAYYTPSHVQSAESPQKMDIDAAAPGSGSGAVGPASPDRYYDGRAGSVSLDDPDVRLAAEALGDLRADFVSSPPNRNTPLPTSSPNGASLGHQHPEPLLSLLTTSHPLLATTIEGATSAYNNSKNFSPRFKSSAEYVEGYLTPIANTVGSVGRVTGVEGSVRWFLGGGRRHKSSSDLEAGDGVSNKRRKVAASSKTPPQEIGDRTPGPEQDVYGFTKDRRTSMSTVDTLPAYDELRSPAYSESAEAQVQLASRPTSSGSAAWQQRLIMSTSGLSIAMSEESLRSLKYCLQWLRWANEHIAKVIAALKTTLEQYEKPGGDDELMQGVEQNGSAVGGGVANRSEVAARINALKSDVLKTLRDVIDTVSKYAGGALPENARELVKRHLTSLPQRFRLATMQDSSAQVQGQDEEAKEKEIKEGAQKVLVLAKEGLDMMAQVSGVLDGTIVSAEEWCERLGRKKREERDSLALGGTPSPTAALAGVTVDRDVKMG